MSRNSRRMRPRLSVRSPSEPCNCRTSDSMRARAMLTSPAPLTMRSSKPARTRTTPVAPGVTAAGGAMASLPSEKRPQSMDGSGASGGGGPGAAASSVTAGVTSGVSTARSTSACSMSGAVVGGSDGASGCAAAGCAALTGAAGLRIALSPAAMWSSRICKSSSSCTLTCSAASKPSIVDSMRCACSPRRMAPARRAPPLKVCRQRIQPSAAERSAGERIQRAMCCCNCGSNSSASSSKMGSNSGSKASTASMSRSMSSSSSIAGCAMATLAPSPSPVPSAAPSPAPAGAATSGQR